MSRANPPRETAQRGREELPLVLSITLHTICGPRIQTHSRPPTETHSLVLLGASHPIRDVICWNTGHTAWVMGCSATTCSPLVCIQAAFLLAPGLMQGPGALKFADGASHVNSGLGSRRCVVRCALAHGRHLCHATFFSLLFFFCGGRLRSLLGGQWGVLSFSLVGCIEKAMRLCCVVTSGW